MLAACVYRIATGLFNDADIVFSFLALSNFAFPLPIRFY